MRVLLLTDSLGCPRKETKVEDTWTDRIIKNWSREDVIFYTYCVHGLSASKIDLEYLDELSPDIIILQIGIVDACRRALINFEQEIVSKIPVLRTFVHFFCSKFHYQLTVVRNIHDCSVIKFYKVLCKIVNQAKGKVYFIKIAPAGEGLIKRVYHVVEDIKRYNNVTIKVKGLIKVDPYKSVNPELYLLQDGHHLNSLGNELLYRCVDSILKNEIK